MTTRAWGKLIGIYKWTRMHLLSFYNVMWQKYLGFNRHRTQTYIKRKCLHWNGQIETNNTNAHATTWNLIFLWMRYRVTMVLRLPPSPHTDMHGKFSYWKSWISKWTNTNYWRTWSEHLKRRSTNSHISTCMPGKRIGKSVCYSGCKKRRFLLTYVDNQPPLYWWRCVSCYFRNKPKQYLLTGTALSTKKKRIP